MRGHGRIGAAQQLVGVDDDVHTGRLELLLADAVVRRRDDDERHALRERRYRSANARISPGSFAQLWIMIPSAPASTYAAARVTRVVEARARG